MSFWQRLSPPGPAGGVAEPDVHYGRSIEGLAARLNRLRHPRLLDLGYTCGSNIEFFIKLGCKVHVDDYIAGLVTRPRPPAPGKAAGGKGSEKEAARAASRNQGKASAAPPLRIPPVDYDAAQFEAILCWDLFDYVGAGEAAALAAELDRVLAPGGYVLGLFSAGREATPRAPRRFRIQAPDQVQVEDVRGDRILPHHLANRDISRIFPGYEVVQTVLLKNGTREMLLQKRRRAETGLVEPRMVSPV